MAWMSWAWAGYRIVRGKPGAVMNMLLFGWVLLYWLAGAQLGHDHALLPARLPGAGGAGGVGLGLAAALRPRSPVASADRVGAAVRGCRFLAAVVGDVHQHLPQPADARAGDSLGRGSTSPATSP
ncbi:MAG: hypothetical protein U0521_01250 [Anaerolineae bacterium]